MVFRGWLPITKYVLLLTAACTFSSGCRRTQAKLASDLPMGNSAITNQLIAGFYDNIGQPWRWTAKRFSVVLLPPAGTERKGAHLLVKIYLPEPEIQKLGPMTLTASVGDIPLPSQTYSKPGSYDYACDVPAFVLSPDRVLPIVFQLDRALAPWQADGRELGVVVSEIRLR